MTQKHQNRSIQERGHYHYRTEQTKHLSSADHKALPTPQEARTQIRCNIPAQKWLSAYKTKTPSNDTQHTAFTQVLSEALWYPQPAHWVSRCSSRSRNPNEDHQSHGQMVKRLLPQIHMYPAQDTEKPNQQILCTIGLQEQVHCSVFQLLCICLCDLYLHSINAFHA